MNESSLGLEAGRLDLSGKIAMVVGAGQTPGDTFGNGRATAILFARAGAKVFLIDRDAKAAELTREDVVREGGQAAVCEADVTSESEIEGAVAECVRSFGRIDVLQNNVGIGISGGDARITEIKEEAFDRILSVNLRGMVYTCKHVIPVMREHKAGVITNISSAAAYANYPYVAYKVSKGAVISLTQHLAITEAASGIRVNVIMPGKMNTPMAIQNRLKRTDLSKEEIVALREKEVPLCRVVDGELRRQMGSAWDVAWASLFLASDAAGFITGAALPVDGGVSVKVGRSPDELEASEVRVKG